MVDIYYDFSNPNGYDTQIAVEASNDNGATWDLNCSSISGDLGEDISAGTDYHIVWDFYADHPNISGSQFKVRILYYFFDSMAGNDGTVYSTVKIGDQWWMAENLRETKYRDNSDIPIVSDAADWANSSSSARCVYNNNESNAETYGYLYNGYAATSSGLAPSGWHVPTDDDWKELERFLGMSESDVNIVDFRGTHEGSKLAGNTNLWQNAALVNNVHFGESNFKALPSGFRRPYDDSFYYSMGDQAIFWSSSVISNEVWHRFLDYENSGFSRHYTTKKYGFSIRLVKD